MSAPRPSALRALIAGTLLVLLGLAAWALFAFQSGSERHAYAHGGNPPTSVRLVSGHTYWISIGGGVGRETELGIDPSFLRCTAATPGQAPRQLTISAQHADTKATDQIASFVSATTGTVQVECDRIGAVYVDNAADAGTDWSGLWLVLTSIALAVGIPLALSALRNPGGDEDGYADAGSTQPPNASSSASATAMPT